MTSTPRSSNRPNNAKETWPVVSPEIAEKVAAAASDPSSPESSLWRMSSWAEGLCGPPDAAVVQLWQGRRAIEKILASKKRLSTNEARLKPRELGLKFAAAWLASRVKASHARKLEELEQSENINFGGLLTYLEMAIALVPTITARRIYCIWTLPEPGWARLGEAMPDTPKSPRVKPVLERYDAVPGATPKPPAVLKVHNLGNWSMSRSFKICRMGEEKMFRHKGDLLLAADITSVRAGVDVLNHRSATASCALVYSPANDYYYCLYSKGERRAALGILGIEEPCGFLSISILAGYNLKNAAAKGQVSDPYVTCQVGRERFRTPTRYDSLHPVWNSDDFQFQVNLRQHEQRTVFLEVFDENRGKLDTSLGVAQIDLQKLETREKHKKLLALVNGGVGQIEVEIEFVEKTEYDSRHPPGTPITAARPRYRRQKPTWGALEQELVFEQEINAFLSTVKPGSSWGPHGYQGKLHRYIHGGFDTTPEAEKVCQVCDSHFSWGSIFCQKCGSTRPGREDKAKDAELMRGPPTPLGSTQSVAAILDMAASSEENLDGSFASEGSLNTIFIESPSPSLLNGRATDQAGAFPDEPLTLIVTVTHGKNFKRSLFTTVPTLSVQCSLLGKPGRSFQTAKIQAMDPAWQEEHQIAGFEAGDEVEFKVFNKDEEIAMGRLDARDIWPDDFDDYLPLSLDGTSLRLSIRHTLPKEGPGNEQVGLSGASPFLAPPVPDSPTRRSALSSPSSPRKSVKLSVDFSAVAEVIRPESKRDALTDPKDEDSDSGTDSDSKSEKEAIKTGFYGQERLSRSDEEQQPASPADAQQKGRTSFKRGLKASSRVKLDDPDSD